MKATAGGFLSDMVAQRREQVSAAFGALKPADLELMARSGPPTRCFSAALSRPQVAVVAEIKRASPSVGEIAPYADAALQARRYQEGGAAAVSVLTEPRVFLGSFDDLADVAAAVDLPVLCKDFVVDRAQVFAARAHGADAVLLMVSVLGSAVEEYLGLARALGMEGLVEVVDTSELAVATSAGARLVAVNARDLRTLEVDREAAVDTVRSARELGVVVVAASGVRSRADVEASAAAGADAVLVGETLMRAESPQDVLVRLVGVEARRSG